MKTSRKTTVCLAMLALAACTARTETLPGQRTETLGDHLPQDVPSLDIYAARGVFMAAVPYSPTALIDHPFTEHVAVTDAALRAKTLERLRAVRVTRDLTIQDKEGRPLPCTYPGNSFGLWLLGDTTMLVLSLPLSELKTAKKDDYSSACLQIGDTSHWFNLSDADVWRAMKPLVK